MGDLTRLTGIEFTLTEREPVDEAALAPMPLKHLDVAVANKVYKVLRRIEAEPGTPIAGWKNRAPQYAIMLGEFDTPKEFLIALAKQLSAQPPEGVRPPQVELPAVYVTRDPSIAFADPSMSAMTDIPEVGVINNDQDEAIARLMLSPGSFTYSINIVGGHDDDISPLALLLQMWLRDKRSNHQFEVRTKILNTEIATGAVFSDGPMVAATNSSVPFNQDRLRMLSLSVTVDVDLLMAEAIREHTARVTFSTEVMHNG